MSKAIERAKMLIGFGVPIVMMNREELIELTIKAEAQEITERENRMLKQSMENV